MISLTRSWKERELSLLREKRSRQVRASLQAWCIEALAPLNQKPAAHHRLLLRHLEQVEAGAITRLMVLMPPGSAKSTYASVLFPAWFMARNPRSTMIAASHTASLAEVFGRRLRNTIQQHSRLLGVSLAPDRQAAGEWATAEGGEYVAVGVGGAITGRRADLCIVDDPVKGREEADSATVREHQWDWWKNDLMTRLRPGARVIVIMTRWHEEDLGGKLLEDAKTGGEQWTVLSLPMEARENDPLGRAIGEPLWPEWFTAAQRSNARRDPRVWSALYQQSPAPDEGTYFLREYLRPQDHMPHRSMMRIYGASDYAVTADGGDYTVHGIVGIDYESHPWLLDLWRGQTSPEEWIEAYCDLVLRWHPIGWAEETGQIRAGVGPFLQRRAIERHAWVARTAFPTRGDKSIRAQSIRGRMAMLGLRYPANAPWRADLEAELLAFPAGKHDDQVDMLGLIGQLLDRMVDGDAPPKPPEPIVGIEGLTMRDAWREGRRRPPEQRI